MRTQVELFSSSLARSAPKPLTPTNPASVQGNLGRRRVEAQVDTPNADQPFGPLPRSSAAYTMPFTVSVTRTAPASSEPVIYRPKGGFAISPFVGTGDATLNNFDEVTLEQKADNELEEKDRTFCVILTVN
ncbi:hypothetical protein BIW11_14206 [Tropilaelaps mercedesae]|uniref:Uncharacterized protein n=1 Tax=Tropilaelaps mercedesae TaxID=418985 RepID=A0A1V9WYR1_9ACAR|nr:hypothetical protein BIW11_14206 [Tropilaelaps mercedesae]